VAQFLRTDDGTVLANLEDWDPSVRSVESWTGELAQALPPVLQSRPPRGFGFPPARDWRENGFDPKVGHPGGYAAWGSWPQASGVQTRDACVSDPFHISRKAVSFTYVCSAGTGSCTVEFIGADEKVHATVSIHSSERWNVRWRVHEMRLPRGEYRLRIQDKRPTGWFAITSPREMSAAGFIARQWIRSGWIPFFVGGVVLTIALAWPVRKNVEYNRGTGKKLKDAPEYIDPPAADPR
jgi:hypothetical protein